MIDTIAHTIAYVFGIGLIGLARGPVTVALTVGIMARLPANRMAHIGIALAICAIGWWAAWLADGVSELADDGRIVIDEAAGAAVMMALAMPRGWKAIVGLGVAFWLFDSLKVWPLDVIEQLPGATGIMLDDIVLGIVLGLGYWAVMAVRDRRAVRAGR